MGAIQNLIDMLKTLQKEQILDIIFAILVYFLFRFASKNLACLTIKILKPKIKKKSEIKQTAWYKPFVALYILLGAYIGIMILKKPLNINQTFMQYVNKIVKIVLILIFANGLSNNLTITSQIVNKMKDKMSPNLEDNTFKFVLKVLRVIIYIIAIFLIVSELGYNLSGLAAGLGIGGVVLTLAAQDLAKNIFGGLAIILDRPFQVGDWIEFNEFQGIVEDITFRSTRVRTFENSVVNIPNANLANGSIINWSRMEQRRNKVNLCIKLDTPMEKLLIVQKRIKEMLMQHDEVIDDTIIVKYDEITDNGINLMVYGYTNSVDYASFLGEKEKINLKILQILREENVELAYDTKSIVIEK